VDEKWTIKISDFGITLKLNEKGIMNTDATVGTIGYVAPEVCIS
jgi:hypothetical protein